MGMNIVLETVSSRTAAPLFHKYEGQEDPQPACLELQTDTGTLRVTWERVRSHDQRDGCVRWVLSPALSASAINSLLHDCIVPAERICMGDRPIEAIDEIHDLCVIYNTVEENWDKIEVVEFYMTRTLAKDPRMLEFTADYTDAGIIDLARELQQEAASNGICVLGNIENYLWELRAQLRKDKKEKRA
jgi:hypothetical protein